MDNLRTLGILLDALDRRVESVLATRAAAPVARPAPVADVTNASSDQARSASQQSVSQQSRDTPGSVARDLPPGDLPPILHDDPLMPLRGGSSMLGNAAPARFGAPPPQSALLDLSSTARWLQQALPDLDTKAARPIRTTVPLVDKGDDANAMREALRDAISQSGLFYESHLAQWSVQRYPESELRREPQARANEPMASNPSSFASESAADATMSLLNAPATDAPHNIELLRAQLHALESRQLYWQGELWPGQAASIAISEDEMARGDEHPSGWRTHLALDLPTLGHVEADLHLQGGVLTLAIRADANASKQLGAARPELAAKFDTRMKAAVSIAIRQP